MHACMVFHISNMHALKYVFEKIENLLTISCQGMVRDCLCNSLLQDNLHTSLICIGYTGDSQPDKV